jgi:hypothetical protein
VKLGNASLKEQIRTVGNRFLNAVEISAQEAADICLQLPMKRSSRQTVFVNTSPPSERVTLLKSQVLDAMDYEDNNIECSNDISRYAERPNSMENVTLAEFVSFYQSTSTFSHSQRASTLDQNLLQEPTACVNDDEITQVQYRRRKHGHILRPVHFNPEVDSEKYYCELIML